jgi:K+-sensing histidine kinase KdpD
MTRAQRTTAAIGAALVVPFLVAALFAQVRDSVSVATVAIVLAGVVVAVGATGSRAAAVTAAVSATLWFDYFHTTPHGSFTIHERDDFIATSTLLFVGLVAAGIQTRSRRRAALAEAGSNEIARVAAVSDLVASGHSVDEIIAIVCVELTDLLHLEHCRYLKLEGDGFDAVLERNGAVTIAGLEWRADIQGLPGPEVELPVSAQGRFGGRFVLVPTPGVPVSFDRRVVAVALADQVGASLAMNLIF